MEKENGLFYLIRSDILVWYRHWVGGPPDSILNPPAKALLHLAWTQVGVRATILFRIAQYLHRKRVKVLPQIIWRTNTVLYGIDLPPAIPVGPGLYIPHPVGSVVMAQSIGSNCTIVSGVTVGLRGEGIPIFPRIGDNVYIGAGARVLGDIVIGNNAKIGANAVVLKSVPENALAVGVPAKIKLPEPVPSSSAVVDAMMPESEHEKNRDRDSAHQN